MTGKLLGKGHFARVEEATHIDLNVKVSGNISFCQLIANEYIHTYTNVSIYIRSI